MLSSPPSNPFLKIIENSTERSNLLSMAHITGSSVWGKKKPRRERYTCTYSGFTLLYGRNQSNIVKQLTPN